MKKLIIIAVIAMGCNPELTQEQKTILDNAMLQKQIDSITEKSFADPSYPLNEREINILAKADSVL